MKYLGIAFLIWSIAIVGFAFKKSDFPTSAPGTEARGLAVMERRCRGILLGMTVLLVGVYLLDRSRSSQALAHAGAALMITHTRFCPKCGKPSRKSECARAVPKASSGIWKQFWIIPPRSCPECGSYVEMSAVRILGLGFVLLFWGELSCFGFQGVPDFVLAPACISGLLGIVVFPIGLLVHERQFRKIKHYLAAHKAPIGAPCL